MATITVELPKESAKQLDELASKLGIPKEVLARVGIEDLLTQPDEQFQKTVDYVLKKMLSFING